MNDQSIRSEVIIRRADSEDASAITEMAVQLGYPTRTGEIAERLEQVMDLDSQQIYVAQAARGEVVGWVHVIGAYHLVIEPSAELGGIVVRDGWREQGVGRLLLEQAERWAMAHGYGLMRVNSNTLRQGVPGFYEHLGYERVKMQNVFYKALR